MLHSKATHKFDAMLTSAKALRIAAAVVRLLYQYYYETN